jgi:hypothetical protein
MDVKKLKQLIDLLGENGEPRETPEVDIGLAVGDKIIIRCVTHYYTGRVVAVTDAVIKLRDAAWIASTGRWANALETGELDEVEPYPGTCYLNRGAVVDWSPWNHPLPREVK